MGSSARLRTVRWSLKIGAACRRQGSAIQPTSTSRNRQPKELTRLERLPSGSSTRRSALSGLDKVGNAIGCGGAQRKRGAKSAWPEDVSLQIGAMRRVAEGQEPGLRAGEASLTAFAPTGPHRLTPALSTFGMVRNHPV